MNGLFGLVTALALSLLLWVLIFATLRGMTGPGLVKIAAGAALLAGSAIVIRALAELER